jgi:sirohydrochlorin cobaltochelatase
MNGLILFAHGARDAGWSAPLQASAVRAGELLPGWAVRLAFLEFMAPDLAACGEELAAAGCQEVVIFPMFLGAGGHVRRDLPAQVVALREQFPEVVWTLQRAAGESGLLIEAMAQAASAAALTRPPAEAG